MGERVSGWRVGVREVLLTQGRIPGWQVVGKEGGRVPVGNASWPGEQ
jgi:hypothetical protein